MPREKKPPRVETFDIADAVTNAFADAESLKDELQEWFDNLPENFQNGSKGDALQEAISAIESAPSEPDVPAPAEGLRVDFTHSTKKRQSRADRMAACVALLQGAAEVARSKAEELQALDYVEDGSALDPDMQDITADMPATEDERDGLVNELESFADDCENAASEWENVEFPGMFS